MYCNAAISYKPTIAQISAATEESEIQRAKKECNSATVEVMGSNDHGAIIKRDARCKKYKELKQRPYKRSYINVTDRPFDTPMTYARLAK